MVVIDDVKEWMLIFFIFADGGVIDGSCGGNVRYQVVLSSADGRLK